MVVWIAYSSQRFQKGHKILQNRISITFDESALMLTSSQRHMKANNSLVSSTVFSSRLLHPIGTVNETPTAFMTEHWQKGIIISLKKNNWLVGFNLNLLELLHNHPMGLIFSMKSSCRAHTNKTYLTFKHCQAYKRGQNREFLVLPWTHTHSKYPYQVCKRWFPCK